MSFDRQQLETFFAVVEARHFGRAARVLNVTRGAVSQRIIALEEAFGTPLLIRDGVTPTPAGEMLLAHIQMLKLLEADTIRRIKPDANCRTKISIAINADSLATWFEPVACAIAKENFALEILVDDQDFTLPVLMRGEAIGCVSTASRAPTGFVAESIGAMEYHCVAAPDFCENYFPSGLNLHSILAAPAVLFNRKDGIHSAFIEEALGFPVMGYATHYFPSPVSLLMAVREGVGYGLVPAMQARPLVDGGELVVLAPGNSIFVNLYWHHWETAPQNAMSINDIVICHARATLIQSHVQLSGERNNASVSK
jgi:LysR family transcriptional regulator (chromosome initiation inhibitor)